MDWPKLNFLRILDPELSPNTFEKITTEWREFFRQQGKSLYIKIPNSVSLHPDIMSQLSAQGSPLVYLKTCSIPSEFNPRFSTKKVTTAPELKEWWRIFSDFGPGEKKFESPFWPITQLAFQSGTQFWILIDSDQTIAACLALDLVVGESSPNLWGVATREDLRRQGCFRSLEHGILSQFTNGYFLQVLENGPLHHYYGQYQKTTVLEIQQRYSLKIDLASEAKNQKKDSVNAAV